MDQLIYLFAAVVLIVSVLASVAIRASPSMWVKVVALCLTAALLPIAYASLAGLLGRPKPVTLEWTAARVAEATVIGASWQEGEAIYLWLRFDGSREPRAYVLPWSRTRAQQLQGALRQANADASSVRMRGLSESGRDPNESVFYAEPQPALPPKTPVSRDSYLGSGSVPSASTAMHAS